MGVKVKICGLTRPEDIEAVNEFMPDYIGLVFTPSRLMVTPEKGAELVSGLDNRIKKVGVFVDRDVNEVISIARICSLDILQFHGSESGKYCSQFKQQIWKAVGIENSESLNRLKEYSVGGILLDSVVNGKCGGTGQTFDWEIAGDISKTYKVILAGGLNAGNVINAINMVKPFCVDVSSGVETDGLKDAHKIKEFIKLVREAV